MNPIAILQRAALARRNELLDAAKAGLEPVDHAAALQRYSVSQHARTYRTLDELRRVESRLPRRARA